MLCKFHQDRSINKKSATEKGRSADVYGGQSAEKNCKRECQYVSLTLPASLPGNHEFARRCGTQSIEKSDRGISRFQNLSEKF